MNEQEMDYMHMSTLYEALNKSVNIDGACNSRQYAELNENELLVLFNDQMYKITVEQVFLRP